MEIYTQKRVGTVKMHFYVGEMLLVCDKSCIDANVQKLPFACRTGVHLQMKRRTAKACSQHWSGVCMLIKNIAAHVTPLRDPHIKQGCMSQIGS